MYLVTLICFFVLGYLMAMKKVISHLRNHVLPKTSQLLDNYESMRHDVHGTAKLGAVIDARMEVTDELLQVLKLPFTKKK